MYVLFSLELGVAFQLGWRVMGSGEYHGHSIPRSNLALPRTAEWSSGSRSALGAPPQRRSSEQKRGC